MLRVNEFQQLLEASFTLTKDAFQAVGSTKEVDGQILDLAHRHLHRTGSPANVGVAVVCDPVRASGGRPGAEQQDPLADRAADLDAAYLEAREHRVDARPSRVLHLCGEVVDAGYRADGGGAGRIVRRLVNSDGDGSALRIGESNNLAKQVVAGVCGEIATSRPRIRPTTLARKISLKFEKLTLVRSIGS